MPLDEKIIMNSGGLSELSKIWQWMFQMNLRRGMERKSSECMLEMIGAPTKFPRLCGWSLQISRMVAGLNLKVFEGVDVIHVEEYVVNWGKKDWLDCADVGLVGCLDAGEVMELLMMSDSFGSGDLHDENGNVDVNTDGQENPTQQDEKDGDVNQVREEDDLLSDQVSQSGALRASGSATTMM